MPSYLANRSLKKEDGVFDEADVVAAVADNTTNIKRRLLIFRFCLRLLPQ